MNSIFITNQPNEQYSKYHLSGGHSSTGTFCSDFTLMKIRLFKPLSENPNNQTSKKNTQTSSAFLDLIRSPTDVFPYLI